MQSLYHKPGYEQTACHAAFSPKYTLHAREYCFVSDFTFITEPVIPFHAIVPTDDEVNCRLISMHLLCPHAGRRANACLLGNVPLSLPHLRLTRSHPHHR